MLNRLVLCSTRQSLMRSVVRQSHSEGIPEKYQKFRPGHMNEFPVPSGLWKEAHSKLQAKYNLQLAAGVAAISITLGYIFVSGVIDLVLPPPYKNE